jgi:hypothetical protein
MFLNHGTMRLPAAIVSMRAAHVPRKRQRGESMLSPRHDAGM